MDVNLSVPKFCLEIGVKFPLRAAITAKHRCRRLTFPQLFILQLGYYCFILFNFDCNVVDHYNVRVWICL